MALTMVAQSDRVDHFFTVVLLHGLKDVDGLLAVAEDVNGSTVPT